MDLAQVPFEFPGNRVRLNKLFLPNENALAKLLQSEKSVLIVGFGNGIENFQKNHAETSLHFVTHSGQWELFSNR
jgi:hypothetical protein